MKLPATARSEFIISTRSGAASKIRLTDDEISTLEALAAETGVDTKGSWENHMN